MPSDIAETWERIDRWLHEHDPDLRRRLKRGATGRSLAATEKRLGLSLPSDVRELWQAHNGSDEYAILGRWSLLSASQAAREWKTNVQVATDLGDPDFWPRNWIPVMGDGAGNFLAVDATTGTLWDADNDPYCRSAHADGLSPWLAARALDLRGEG